MPATYSRSCSACVTGCASSPNKPGLPRKEQNRLGRLDMLDTPYATIEREIRSQLQRMLASGGFDARRDIVAITVNRWPHGYSYVANSLYDPDDYEQSVLKVARQSFSPVAIANTDAGGDAWVHYAIDQADRAVKELLG